MGSCSGGKRQLVVVMAVETSLTGATGKGRCYSMGGLNMTEHKFTKKAIIVSSCHARQCHPETCCCRDDEYAINDYIKGGNHRTYWGTAYWGTKAECEDMLKEFGTTY